MSAAARKLAIRRPVLFVTIPTAYEVVKGMERQKLVFNRSDKHSEFGDADAVYIGNLERALLREADHVVYVSHSLMEEERSLAGSRAHFLDHGVDLDRCDAQRTGAEPADLRDVARPRMGFVGALDAGFVDFDLLVQLAR